MIILQGTVILVNNYLFSGLEIYNPIVPGFKSTDEKLTLCWCMSLHNRIVFLPIPFYFIFLICTVETLTKLSFRGSSLLMSVWDTEFSFLVSISDILFSQWFSFCYFFTLFLIHCFIVQFIFLLIFQSGQLDFSQPCCWTLTLDETSTLNIDINFYDSFLSGFPRNFHF